MSIIRDFRKELNIKTQIHYITSFLMMFVGCGCVVASLFIPPQGVIDPSVLYFIGMIFAFTSAVFGIDIKYNTELEKLRTELRAEAKQEKEEDDLQ